MDRGIETEILRRRDMRNVLTWTIDPDDAKDFDDALSYAELEDGNLQIGVHIADVTHYVHPGDEIDEEAYKRGTSVYLVDRVIPMLPEELCNDLCSLKENEDKLCMSVIFTMDKAGKILKYKICRTVICSNRRLTYHQALEILDQAPTDELSQALHTLNQFAQQMRQKRLANGALELESEEMRFRLDEHNYPVEIYFEKPTPANQLIEEWMLLANRIVATHVGNKPFVYRIHDKPDQDKLQEVHQLEKYMHRKKQDKQVNQRLIDILTIRAMAKAVYSPHNIGHYGLAFSHYTHFTSPIRRYPDMIVHRLLDKYVLSGKGTEPSISWLQEQCEHLSDCESEAQQAERESIKEMAAIWMSDHMDSEYDAHISNVTEFGIFIELDCNHIEGLIHITNIVPHDYIVYDEKNYRLIAEESGETFTLGDPIRVKPIQVNQEKGQINFVRVV